MKNETSKIADVNGNYLSKLCELCDLENAENIRKSYNNLTKGVNEIEPFCNTHFLNLIGYVKKNFH